ncbi:MAG: hypothetical protein QM669_12090, partial [Siphonobacter sp.]
MNQNSTNKHRFSKYFLPFSISIDVVLLTLCFLASYVLRPAHVHITSIEYRLFCLFFDALWVVIVLLGGTNKYSRTSFELFSILSKLFIALLWHIAIVSILWVSIQGYFFSRVHLLLTYFLFATFAFGWRATAVYFLRYIRFKGLNNRKFVVVGWGELSGLIVNYYRQHPEMGMEFNGYFDVLTPENQRNLRGDISLLSRFIQEHNIDIVYVCLPYLDNKVISYLLKNSIVQNTSTKLIIDFQGFIRNRMEVEYHGNIPILNVYNNNHAYQYQIEIPKRIFDIVFASSVLIIASPFYILVAIITKLT